MCIKGICFRIAESRKIRGMTQKELSKKIGKSIPVVGDYENSRAKPSIETIQLISEALNVPTTYLIYGESFTIKIGL